MVMIDNPDRQAPGRQEIAISKGWVQGVALVLIFGFFVMGVLAYRTYTASMPQPQQVVSEQGEVVYTGEQITNGQNIFLTRGLQQYGSVVGHGAYLGPDYTAEYLRLSSEHIHDRLVQEGVQDPQAATAEMQRTNRYDASSGTLVLTPEQVTAFESIKEHYAQFYGEPTTRHGLVPNKITDPQDIHDLTAFYGWTAWASAAERPGLDYSYTNNWPPEPRVNNQPTADILVWSGISLVALLAGLGILFAVYGRWSANLGWKGNDTTSLRFLQPGEVGITKAQRSTAWFFLVVSILFLVQATVGASVEHYRVELEGFFGFDLAQIFPFNLARTWHVQLSLLWTAAAFLAAAIFLAPIISGREPKGQHYLSYGLLGALALVVVGMFGGTAISIYGPDWAKGSIFFSQQWEYLDLPRFFQILLVIGLFLWFLIIVRAIRSRLRTESKFNMPWLFTYAALAIPAFYAVGLLAMNTTHLTVAEFWRFWVVHLWVEDFLELFTTVMVAYVFVMLGVVRRKIAIQIILLDVILYSAGGVIGTMHHLYFSGTPVEHMALGAVFSALEVIPLTFLTIEAWTFLQLGARQESRSSAPFPHRWAVMFLVAVGFWNFLGAGVFGFLVNLPIVSYYQIGTALTANHAHGAMMGVYGMLAVGLALFALRYIIPAQRWPDRLARLSFWSLNIGLAWMMFATLLPLGTLQLWASVNQGYYEARTLAYLTQPGNLALEWMRMPGDVVFLIGGILPFIYIAWLGVRYGVRATVTRMEPETLYVVESPEAEADRTGRPAEPVGASAPTSASETDTTPRPPSRYASDRRRADRDEERQT